MSQEYCNRKAARDLEDFFRRNQEEELSSEDACVKFGMSRRTAVNALASLSGSGVLERVSVYRLRKTVEEGGMRVAE